MRKERETTTTSSDAAPPLSPMGRLRAIQARMLHRDRTATQPAADSPDRWRMDETIDYDARASGRRERVRRLAEAAGYPALPFGVVAQGVDAWERFLAQAADDQIHLAAGFIGSDGNEYDPRIARADAEDRAAIRAARFLLAQEEDELDGELEGWRPGRRATD